MSRNQNINLQKFNQDLDKINWDTTGLEDAHEYGNNFFNVFNQILDIHAPITEIKSSKSRTKRNTKPWITTEMLKLVKSKDKTYQQFIKEKDPTAKEELNAKYKQQKNEITKLTRKAKKLHFNEYFAKNSANTKKLWAGINQILN